MTAASIADSVNEMASAATQITLCGEVVMIQRAGARRRLGHRRSFSWPRRAGFKANGCLLMKKWKYVGGADVVAG